MTRGRRSAAQGLAAPVLATVLLVTATVGACSPGATTGAPSGGLPSASVASPAASGFEAPSNLSGQEPLPSPTSWPGNVVEAVLLLGKADLEIQKAGVDLSAAAASEDLEAMWGAADGLAILLAKLEDPVDRIRDYPTTDELARAYDAALPTMLEGSTQLRDAITAGDAAAIAAGSQRLAEGLAAYHDVRALLAPIVGQAALMQRILVK